MEERKGLVLKRNQKRKNEIDLIESETINTLDSLIGNTILDPAFKFNILGIEPVDSYSIHSNLPITLLNIKIVTNNRPLLLGQVMHFPVNGRSGFYPNYFIGYLEGYLSQKFGSQLLDRYDFAFEIKEENNSSIETRKYLPLNFAIRHEIISSSSKLVSKMRQHELSYLLISGSAISGPSLDMICAIEELFRNYRINSVLDVFSGTGSLAKVSIINGAEKVICLDVYPGIIEKNLGKYASKCAISSIKDAFKYKINDDFDLVILDPFYDNSFEVAKIIVPHLAENAKIIVFNIANKEEEYWINKVLNEFEKYVTKIMTRTYYRSTIALGFTKNWDGAVDVHRR